MPPPTIWRNSASLKPLNPSLAGPMRNNPMASAHHNQIGTNRNISGKTRARYDFRFDAACANNSFWSFEFDSTEAPDSRSNFGNVGYARNERRADSRSCAA